VLPGTTRRRFSPIAASLEPGEDWRWCYIDEMFV
jgi:hypothetical protein